MKIVKQRLTLNLLNKVNLMCCSLLYPVFVQTLPIINQTKESFSFNLFIKEKDRSATYIDMHEIHVETL